MIQSADHPISQLGEVVLAKSALVARFPARSSHAAVAVRADAAGRFHPEGQAERGHVQR